jgi:serine/threonine protein kinase
MQVYEVRSREDTALYAVKTVRKYNSSADRKRRIEEMYVANRLGDHPHLVKYYDAWEEGCQLFIKMELCGGGSLKEYVLRHHPIAEETLWSFFYDILQGLSHMHAHGYTHFDIKPENIFVTDNNSLKVLPEPCFPNPLSRSCQREEAGLAWCF